MPDSLARCGVHAHQRFTKQSVSLAMSAIPIVGGRAEWQVNVAQILVRAHERPDVRVAAIFPRFVFPSLDAEFALLRYRMKNPSWLAGPRVKGLNVAARGFLVLWAVGNRRADNHVVSADHGRRSHRIVAGVDRQRDRFCQVHLSAFAEFGHGFPGLGVDRPQVRIVGSNIDPLLAAVGPIRHAAMHEAEIRRAPDFIAFRIEDPNRLARLGIDRGNLGQRRAGVQCSADHQRRHLVVERAERAIFFLQRQVRRIPGPGDLQRGDVILIDLIEGRVFRAARVAAVVPPLARRFFVLSQTERRAHGQHDGKDQGNAARSDRKCRGHFLLQNLMGLMHVARMARSPSIAYRLLPIKPPRDAFPGRSLNAFLDERAGLGKFFDDRSSPARAERPWGDFNGSYSPSAFFKHSSTWCMVFFER